MIVNYGGALEGVAIHPVQRWALLWVVSAILVRAHDTLVAISYSLAPNAHILLQVVAYLVHIICPIDRSTSF
jgi:hypothetical protein